MAATDPRTDIPATARAGWQCPECKTVYSPDVRQCGCAAAKQSPAERVRCTCPPVWGGLVPPPACPVHGQTEMYQVRCWQ